MRTVGQVRYWSGEEGWGVIDSDATPGGCWTHFSHLAMPGYRALRAGQSVSLEWEPGEQDGYTFRAVRVWVGDGEPPDMAPDHTLPDSAYVSSLTIEWDTTMPPEQ